MSIRHARFAANADIDVLGLYRAARHEVCMARSTAVRRPARPGPDEQTGVLVWHHHHGSTWERQRI